MSNHQTEVHNRCFFISWSYWMILVRFVGNTCFVWVIRGSVIASLLYLQHNWKMQLHMDLSDAMQGSREEHEFKLRAELFSNSCCRSPVHSVDLCCVFCALFLLMKPQWEFCTWHRYRVSIIYAVKIRGEKFSPNVILYQYYWQCSLFNCDSQPWA